MTLLRSHMLKFAAVLAASSLAIAQEAPVKKDPQILVQYMSRPAPVVSQFGPAFQPFIWILATSVDASLARTANGANGIPP